MFSPSATVYKRHMDFIGLQCNTCNNIALHFSTSEEHILNKRSRKSSQKLKTLDIICKKRMRRGGKRRRVILGSTQTRVGCHGFRVAVPGAAGPMGGRQLVA